MEEMTIGQGMAAAPEMEVDSSSAAANKTLTGELATAEKIAAYHIELPPLSFGRKIITVIELIVMTYIIYITVDFMIHHITHVIHMLSHPAGH